ncbi:MAG TPA: DUF3892 domain-containing protein [Allosphingosinicella sp.]|jgi:hypothetical protein
MADYQITHIIPDRSDPDRRIDAVYGPACGLLPLDTAIQWIANGHTFWTLVGFYRADVYYVPPTALVRHHLTTSRDGYQPNNLLSLPHYQYA